MKKITLIIIGLLVISAGIVVIQKKIYKNTPISVPDSVKLEWLFAKGKTIEYLYNQEMNAVTKFNEKDDDKGMLVKVSGKILITGKSEKEANLSLTAKLDGMNFGEEEPPDEMKKDPIKVDLKFDISKDGTIIGERYAHDDGEQLLFDMLLPIPGTTIRKGEIFTRKVNIPPMGNQLSMEGTIKTVFTEAIRFKGYDCVKIINTIDIKSYSGSSSPTSRGNASCKGNSTGYFAYKEGFFVEINSDIEILLNVISPANSKTPVMNMKQSHKINIKLTNKGSGENNTD
jgi:hypothetical protein